MTEAPSSKANQVEINGLLKYWIPGLTGYRMDNLPFLIMTSEMDWHSTATRTSRKPVPFNYRLVDIWTRLITAPVGNSGIFRAGTATDGDLFFTTTPKIAFNSNSAVTTAAGLVRRTNATGGNFATAAASGLAGQLLQMQTRRVGTGAFSTKGAVVGIFAVIPRDPS